MDVPVVVIRVSDKRINARNIGEVVVSGSVSIVMGYMRFVEIRITGAFSRVIDMIIEGDSVYQMMIWSDVNIRKVKVDINVINHFAIIGYGHSDKNLIRTDLYFEDKQKIPIYITNLGNDRFNIFGVYCSGILDRFVLAHATSKFEGGHMAGSMVFVFMESILYDGRPFKYSNRNDMYYFRVSVDIGEYRINFVHSISGVSFVKVSKLHKEIKSWDECPEAFDGGISVKSSKK
jgi:hypothetical protein